MRRKYKQFIYNMRKKLIFQCEQPANGCTVTMQDFGDVMNRYVARIAPQGECAAGGRNWRPPVIADEFVESYAMRFANDVCNGVNQLLFVSSFHTFGFQ